MTTKPSITKWKNSMTDRERFNNQMHYGSVDRCFNLEMFGFWEENYSLWDVFIDNGIRHGGDAHRFFNWDNMSDINGNLWMSPYFESKVIEETMTTKIIMNRDGLLAEMPKDDHTTVPHFMKSSIVTPEDWEKVKAERFRRDDPMRKVDIDAQKKKHPKDRTYPLGVCTGSMIGRIRDMLTFEGLAYACFDYPEMVEDMVETSCLLVEDFLDQILPHFDFDFASGWEDICYKNGPIVTVDFLKEVVMPRYKRINKKLKAHGIDLWFTDCDGDVRQILPYLLESGINCIIPFEVNCSGHPAELLNKYGKELRIMGGFDKLEMAKGKEAIKAYMESLVPLVERGGFIPFCDHACPPDVKDEDYLYYLDLKEKMFDNKMDF